MRHPEDFAGGLRRRSSSSASLRPGGAGQEISERVRRREGADGHPGPRCWRWLLLPWHAKPGAVFPSSRRGSRRTRWPLEQGEARRRSWRPCRQVGHERGVGRRRLQRKLSGARALPFHPVPPLSSTHFAERSASGSSIAQRTESWANPVNGAARRKRCLTMDRRSASAKRGRCRRSFARAAHVSGKRMNASSGIRGAKDTQAARLNGGSC